MSIARFGIGQLVHHRLFGYRGVIVDVDPEYQGSDEWYEQVATTRPPRDEPWYHVLVDGSDAQTYVAQRNLELDWHAEPVEHPLIPHYFAEFSGHHYLPNWRSN